MGEEAGRLEVETSHFSRNSSAGSGFLKSQATGLTDDGAREDAELKRGLAKRRKSSTKATERVGVPMPGCGAHACVCVGGGVCVFAGEDVSMRVSSHACVLAAAWHRSSGV